MLIGYNRSARDTLVRGFRYGFRIGFNGHNSTVVSKNHNSASRHNIACHNIIKEELSAGRLAGPFINSPFKEYYISPIGIIPKKDKGKYRLIHDLSFPRGSSVNDGIPLDIRSVNYEPFDNAISYIVSQGSGVTVSKIDIKSAFRICPVHPADRHLLGMQWDGKLYFDKTLAMGLASSCKIFECFSSALKWIILKLLRNVYVAKILDDFLLITAAAHPCPGIAFNIMKAIFNYIGVPLADDKSVAPCKRLVYLGLEIDVINMCIRLPPEKIKRCKQLILTLMSRKKVRLKEIQSLCGLLQFACRAIIPGRPFLRRLYDATKGIENPKYFIRVSAHMKKDLAVWLTFLSNYNGRTMLLSQMFSTPDYTIITDASKSFGFGAICGNLWLCGEWPQTWKKHAITMLEFGPILFAIATWSHLFNNKCIHVKTDNLALVSIVNKQTSTDLNLMFMVRKMVKLLLKYNILLKASHILGHDNKQADLISRGRIDLFQVLHPSATSLPSIIPPQWDPINWAPPLQA